jgi:hypothetical protein
LYVDMTLCARLCAVPLILLSLQLTALVGIICHGRNTCAFLSATHCRETRKGCHVPPIHRSRCPHDCRCSNNVRHDHDVLYHHLLYGWVTIFRKPVFVSDCVSARFFCTSWLILSQHVLPVRFHPCIGDEGVVPRRRRGVRRSGTRTDSRWSDAAYPCSVHRICHSQAINDRRIKMDFVHQRECDGPFLCVRSCSRCCSQSGTVSRALYLTSFIHSTEHVQI